MVLADISFGDLLWGLIVFFFMIVYLMMLFSVILDLFRDKEQSGVAKALWVVFLLIFPLISLLVYLIARGDSMAARSIADARAAESQMQGYIREAASTSPVDQIASAKALLDQGVINSEEFEALKQKALA